MSHTEGEDDDGEEEEKKEEGLPKGTVLVVDELNEETMREDIKAVLKDTFEVDVDEAIGFVYYQKGEPTAKLRFLVGLPDDDDDDDDADDGGVLEGKKTSENSG